MAGEIIIGYDPAHDRADAVRLGRVFADILAAKPLVVAALPWPSYLMGVEALQEQINGDMAEDFAAVRKQLSGLEVETRAIATPSVAGTLHQLAESEPVELIVLGSSHRGPVGRTLTGSVGESLMHGARCAIAVAPRGYGKRDSYQLLRIGVAYDGSPESSTALETAIGIAERCHGRITVLVVADYPHYGYETTWSVLTAGEIRDAEHEEKERLLAAAVARLPVGLDDDSRVLVGDAGPLLSQASDDFDLLVTGSRSYGPVRRTILGSTTRKLIHSSACPVLVLPRGVGDDPFGLRIN